MLELNKIKEVVLGVLFPRICFGCNKEGKYICEDCKIFLGEASLICPVCEKSSFTGQRHMHCSTRYGLDGLVGVWEYEGITKEALFKIKYWSNFDAISEFMENAFEAMKKEKRKGFNQAKVIVKAINKIMEKETTSLLMKNRDTLSQTHLNKEERIKNVKDCFSILPNLSLMPRNLVLVDDVWTTGATMKECCKVLKKAGVQNIWGFTLFRTV